MPTPDAEGKDHMAVIDRAVLLVDKLQQNKKNAPWEKRYEKALEDLRAKLESFKKLASDNKSLKNRLWSIETAIQLAAHEEQFVRLTNVRLPVTPSAPNTARVSAISFGQLPSPEAWDQSWVDVIRTLETRDMLIIRKQFLQDAAMLLPKAEYFGAGSEQHKQLDAMYERFICFAQRAFAVRPKQWNELSCYSLDTLEHLADPPDKKWRDDFLCQHFITDKSDACIQIYDQLQATLATLHLEYAQHAALVLKYSGLPDAGAHGPDGVEVLEEVLQRMQVNMNKQLYALRQYMHGQCHAKSSLHMIKAGLLMYPFALGTLDFLDSFRDFVRGVVSPPSCIVTEDKGHIRP